MGNYLITDDLDMRRYGQLDWHFHYLKVLAVQAIQRKIDALLFLFASYLNSYDVYVQNCDVKFDHQRELFAYVQKLSL